MDTGAELSLIKKDVLKENVKVNKEEVYSLQTPFGSGKTLGSCKGKIITKISNTKSQEIPCKFHVIANKTDLPQDGLLGNDFLSKNCKIDGPKRTLEFPRTETNATEFKYPITLGANESDTQKAIDDKFKMAGMESEGVKLFTDQNFKSHDDLVKNCKALKEPGFKNKEFLANTPKIDGDRFHTIVLEKPRCVPARSRMVVRIPLMLPEEMLCLSQEISDGVFLANCIFPSNEKSVLIGLLNVNNEDVMISHLKLQMHPVQEYNLTDLAQRNSQELSNIKKLESAELTTRISRSGKCPTKNSNNRGPYKSRPNFLYNQTEDQNAQLSRPRSQPNQTEDRNAQLSRPKSQTKQTENQNTQLSRSNNKYKATKSKKSNKSKTQLQSKKQFHNTNKFKGHEPTINVNKNYSVENKNATQRKVNNVQRTRASKCQARVAKLEQELNLSPILNKQEKLEILRICKEYNDLFHLKGDRLTYTDAITHSIPILQDQAPVNQKMYRLPEKQREVINEQLKEMLENDVVQRSKSPWNSPLLVVPKKAGPDGEKRWRVVVDFRKLNEKTVGDAFPLPRIEDILDQLGHSRYFTTLDLASGYHQVLVDPKDRQKTAFSTNYGHYEFKRMPFGLKGAPATFQRLMNYVLTGLQGLECFVYLDDIVIYGKNLEDHNNKLRKVFDKLREHNLKLQPEKCQFLRKEVVYLGHKCSEEGALPDPSKTSCVQNFPVPRTVRQVQSFLGLANYYRKFINNFSKIVRPITNLLRKDVKFTWTDKCQEAFESIKKSLISPPLLIYPDFNKPFNLTTDASNEALGAVLSQGKVGQDRPIAYASRTLNKAEKNYSTIEKELLAIVWATRNFRCYLQGRKFTVYTDHKPLKGVFNVKDPTSRLVRFHHKLSEFDYNIEYKPGKYNTNADTLSRIPLAEDDETKGHIFSVESQVHSEMNDKKEIIENAKGEGKVRRVRAVTRAQARKTQLKCEESKNDKENAHKDNQFMEKPQEEEICDKEISEVRSGTQKPIEWITKPEEIKIILHDYHDSPFGGHQGVIKTYKKIRRKYKWKNMLKDIKNYVKRCPKCQKMKASLQLRVPMVITDTAEQPFDKVYLDIVGPLEDSSIGNRYILTFQDNLTKFVDWYAIPNAEAETIAKIFFDEIITRYRIPKQIVTDQGTNFLSSLFKQVCKLLRIKKLQTSAYHPQSNGALERAHRPLIEYLRTVIDDNPKVWDQYLRTAAFVYNNSVHEGTKLTPMDCLFGFTAEVPSNLKRNPEPVYNHESYYSILRHKLQRSYAIARKNILNNKEKSKMYYDQKTKPCSYHVGDKVLLKAENRKHKLTEIWAGPYRVTAVKSPVNTEISIGKRTKIIHNNRLKLFYE